MDFFDAKWPAALLWPLSRIYGSAASRRNQGFEQGRSAVHRLSCPVISIGNIVVGGTGKTPTVIFMTRWLQERGKKVCVLSRGYGRQSKGLVLVADGEHIRATVTASGDEPMMMALQLPGAIVVTDADRVRGGKYVLAQFKPDLILLDDGFQHRRLHRDLDIVTFKSAQDLGNGWLLPAGPLREPLAGLARADLLWFNERPGGNEEAAFARFAEKPRIEAHLRMSGSENASGAPLSSFQGVRAVLFCGLAKPRAVLTTALNLGLDVVRFFHYKDHHEYRHRDIRDLEKAKRSHRADVIITTDKDWVKINPMFQLPPYWYRLTVALQPEDPFRTDNILHALCVSRGIL